MLLPSAEVIFTANSLGAAFPEYCLSLLFEFIGPYKKAGRVISLGTKTIRPGPCRRGGRRAHDPTAIIHLSPTQAAKSMNKAGETLLTK